jgi:nitroreductase
MDVHLAVASKRDSRAYSGADVSDEVARRILDAGRLVGSARNRQPFRFIVVEGEAVPPVADTVYVPRNVLDAGLVVVVVVSPGGGMVDFDAGRAAQSMMLAGWADGVTSCPNGIADPDGLAQALAIEPPERAVVVIGFGPPRKLRDLARRTAEEWSARAKREPLDSIVTHVGAVAG